MDGIKDMLGNIMKPLENMPKEIQISNIALQLTLVGINKGLSSKDVVDYFYQVITLMKTHKKAK